LCESTHSAKYILHDGIGDLKSTKGYQTDTLRDVEKGQLQNYLINLINLARHPLARRLLSDEEIISFIKSFNNNDSNIMELFFRLGIKRVGQFFSENKKVTLYNFLHPLI